MFGAFLVVALPSFLIILFILFFFFIFSFFDPSLDLNLPFPPSVFFLSRSWFHSFAWGAGRVP